MSTAIETYSGQLAPEPPKYRMTFTELEVAEIRRTIAPNATDAEFNVFMAMSGARGLNPMTKEIYFVKYGDRSPAAHIVSIGALRRLADSHDTYLPGREPEYEYNDKGQLRLARVYAQIFKRGQWHEISEIALYDEYVQLKDGRPNQMWAKMEHNQLAKCAEAKLLRKGWPRETAGLYVEEEFSGRTWEGQEVKSAAAPPVRGQRPAIASSAPTAQAENIVEGEVTEAPQVTDVPRFSKGKLAGKSAPELTDAEVTQMVEYWEGGKNFDNFMQDSVKAEYTKRSRARDAAEAAPEAQASPTPAPAAEPVPQPEQAPPAEVKESKPRQPKHITALILAIEKKGLSMAPEQRDNRLAAINCYRQQSGLQPVTSMKEIEPGADAERLRISIDGGQVWWFLNDWGSPGKPEEDPFAGEVVEGEVQ